MHLYELLACLALISSVFVCVVVHVTQKGYPIWCYPVRDMPTMLRRLNGRYKSVSMLDWC